jgi:translation initiation factor RLI1
MDDLPEFNVSYKPQKISPKFDSTVERCRLTLSNLH